MINALHLLWIIPLSTTAGFLICAIFCGGEGKSA